MGALERPDKRCRTDLTYVPEPRRAHRSGRHSWTIPEVAGEIPCSPAQQQVQGSSKQYQG